MPPVFSKETVEQNGTVPTNLEPPEPSLTYNEFFDNVVYDWKSSSANQYPPPWSATNPGEQNSTLHQLTRLTPNLRYETSHSGHSPYASNIHDRMTYEYPPASNSETSRHFRSIAPRTHAPALICPSPHFLQVSSEMAPVHRNTTEDLRELVVRCNECNTPFTGVYRGRNLTRHVKTMHERIPCQCVQCHRTFRRSDARTKHYRRCHPELMNRSGSSNQDSQVSSDCGQPSTATNASSVQSENDNSITGCGHIPIQFPLSHTASVCGTSDMSGSQDIDTGSFNYTLTSLTELSFVPDQFEFFGSFQDFNFDL
jgi:hypothetical protein